MQALPPTPRSMYPTGPLRLFSPSFCVYIKVIKDRLARYS